MALGDAVITELQFEDERSRLEEVERVRPRKPTSKGELDDVVAVTAQALDAPMAAVSLVGADEQTFEARTGLDLERTAREHSFCAHTIDGSRDPMVVEDALEDPRFDENPYVLGEPGIRFYAGAPIETHRGYAVGTLCILDTQPRQFTADQQATLRRLRSSLTHELELGARVRSLEHRNEALSRFTTFVAHELKGPLTALVGNLELVADGARTRLPEDDASNVEAALTAANRLEAALEGLSSYTELQDPGERRQPVPLDRIVDDVAEAMSGELADHQGRIEADRLPTVQGHQGLLRLLFRNLVENALKYHGDRRPQVTIDAEPTGDTWRIGVHDEGRGVPTDRTEGLFELFSRADDGSEEGAGVGLALCKLVVEQHGGEIWIDSEAGEGTSVYLTLPRAEVD